MDGKKMPHPLRAGLFVGPVRMLKNVQGMEAINLPVSAF